MKSVAHSIEKTITSNRPMLIWHANDFVAYGKTNNIKTVLSRLAKKGVLKRIISGYYYRPFPESENRSHLAPTSFMLAVKIAKVNGWTVAPTRRNALISLLLSTDLSSPLEWVSDGPNRIYHAFGETIIFRHKSPRLFAHLSEKTATFVEGVRFLGGAKISDENILRLVEKLQKEDAENIEFELRNSPAWIHSIADKVRKLVLFGRY